MTDLESFAFGDSPALADELLALVLAGKKTATCWAASREFSNWIAHRVAESGNSCFARTTCADLERRPDADGV
jgi:uncharacterized protein YhfF